MKAAGGLDGAVLAAVLGPVLWPALLVALVATAMADARAQCLERPGATQAPHTGGGAGHAAARCAAEGQPGPADAGAWLQRGLTLAAAERYAAAESAFGQALALAPDQVDAHLGLARLAFWQGRLGEADRHVRRALAIDPGRQDAGDLLDRIDAARPRRWRIDLDAGVSHLSEGRSPWREGALRIGLAATPATTVSAGLAASERFAIRDLYLEGRVDHRVSDALSAYLALGGAPDAEFLPVLAIRAGGSVRVSKGGAAAGPTLLTLHVRHASYRSNDVTSLMPGATQYLLDGRVWIAGRLIAAIDHAGVASAGYLVRADARLAEAVSVHVGWADAPEPEAGVMAEVRTVFGGFAIDLSDGVTLRVSGAHERRSGAYARTSATLGMTFRF